MVLAAGLDALLIVYIVVEESHSLQCYPFDTQYLQVSQGHLKASRGLVGIARQFVICDKLPRVLHSSGSNHTRYTYVRSNFASALKGFPWFALCARNDQTTLPLWGNYWYVDESNLRKSTRHKVHRELSSNIRVPVGDDVSCEHLHTYVAHNQ